MRDVPPSTPAGSVRRLVARWAWTAAGAAAGGVASAAMCARLAGPAVGGGPVPVIDPAMAPGHAEAAEPPDRADPGAPVEPAGLAPALPAPALPVPALPVPAYRAATGSGW